MTIEVFIALLALVLAVIGGIAMSKLALRQVETSRPNGATTGAMGALMESAEQQRGELWVEVHKLQDEVHQLQVQQAQCAKDQRECTQKLLEALGALSVMSQRLDDCLRLERGE